MFSILQLLASALGVQPRSDAAISINSGSLLPPTSILPSYVCIPSRNANQRSNGEEEQKEMEAYIMVSGDGELGVDEEEWT